MENQNKEAELLNFIKGFKTKLPNYRQGEWSKATNDNGDFSIGVRYWGNWKSNEEDDDNPELDTKDCLIASKAFKDYIESSPYKEYVTNVYTSVNEKSWIDFSFSAK